jgi:predicted GNAT family N-acyltransferase
MITLWKSNAFLCTTRFTIKKFNVLPTQCICVFCVDLRTNSDYSLYSINWLVFITETECVYCAVRSAHTVYLCVLCGSENKHRLFHCTALNEWFLKQISCILRGTFCPHSVFMYFVWIWEQTAIISLYRINWLVFITKTECVYCAVCSAHTVYLCVFFLWIWEHTAIISLHSINWLVFRTEMECVYCAVRSAHTVYLCVFFLWIWE